MAKTRAPIPSAKLMAYALRLLSIKDYSESKMRERLYTVAEEQSGADSCIERLKDLSLIDDTAYAEKLARYLTETKGYGKRRVVQDMMRRGVDRTLAEETVAEQDSDPSDAISTYIDKRNPDLSDEKQRRKTIDALMRRGFNYDDIMRQVRLRREE